MSKIRIAGFVNDSIVDGPGLRFTLFTQGCNHHCKGCHNLHTHSIEGGYEIDGSSLIERIKENPLLSGVTISGGEPFLQAASIAEFAKGVKAMRLEVAIYTGFTYEELIATGDADIFKALQFCDILIDGRFVEKEKSMELRFKGSKNQRTIDIKESLNKGVVVVSKSPRWT